MFRYARGNGGQPSPGSRNLLARWTNQIFNCAQLPDTHFNRSCNAKPSSLTSSPRGKCKLWGAQATCLSFSAACRKDVVRRQAADDYRLAACAPQKRNPLRDILVE